MTNEAVSLTKAEAEIMREIWKADVPMTAAEVGRLVEDRGWKRTTVATFLAKLVEKGVLTAERRGRALYYTAKISQKEYKRGQTHRLIRTVFGGSARELVAALAEEGSLTGEDIAELREIFNKEE